MAMSSVVQVLRVRKLKSYRPDGVKWLEKAADKNNDTAQNMLGVIYENGDGVSQDYSQAESWYRKAALNGNEAGLYNLGDLYERGRGVVKDPDRAARRFRKAALNGFDLAQFKLGSLYYCGEGVAQAPKKALQWFCSAAEQGHPHAKHFLETTSPDFEPNAEDLYKKGQYFFEQREYEEAFLWLNRSANQDYAEAKNSLGLLFDYGKGCERNPLLAMDWYQRACGQLGG